MQPLSTTPLTPAEEAGITAIAYGLIPERSHQRSSKESLPAYHVRYVHPSVHHPLPKRQR